MLLGKRYPAAIFNNIIFMQCILDIGPRLEDTVSFQWYSWMLSLKSVLVYRTTLYFVWNDITYLALQHEPTPPGCRARSQENQSRYSSYSLIIFFNDDKKLRSEQFASRSLRHIISYYCFFDISLSGTLQFFMPLLKTSSLTCTSTSHTKYSSFQF